MKRIILFFALTAFTVSVLGSGSGQDMGSMFKDCKEIKKLKLTILYDNYKAVEGTKTDWGFSCLIEADGKMILFDTGGKPDVLKHNIDTIGVDLKKTDLIVISHIHWDHIGGLPTALAFKSTLPIYVPKSFPAEVVSNIEKSGAKVILVDQSVKICEGIVSTGEMGTNIKEHSLVLNTESGLVIITGCSHPGIVDIVKKAKEIIKKDVFFVIGGFHLMPFSDDRLNAMAEELKKIGVKYCSATHCTGDKAIKIFKDKYQKAFIDVGTGKILTIENGKINITQ